MRNAINLAELPPPSIIEELDYETILAEIFTDLQTQMPELTAHVESDPAYKILEVVAYRELLLRQRINDASRSVMLAYATETDLDHIAARFNVKRLLIQAENLNSIPPITARYESDAALRRRTQLALERLALAGTQNAYIFETLSSHPNIRDATAMSHAPGEVTITILTYDEDGTPDAQTLQVVTEHLHQETVRTLTDNIKVQAGQIKTYVIHAQLFSPQTPESEVLLQEAKVHVARYAKEQFALGKNIRRSAIASALHVAGVQHVVIESPASDLIFDAQTAGQCTDIKIQHAGVDD